jgi:uncharacterized protein
MTAALLGVDRLLLDAAEPELDETTGPFYEAAARQELVLRFCTEHGHPLDLDQIRCELCGAPAGWRPAEPRGRVLAGVVMHRLERSMVAVDRPYAVFDVELTSGHRLYLASIDPTTPALAPGTEIEIGWVLVGSRAIPRVIPPDQQRTGP